IPCLAARGPWAGLHRRDAGRGFRPEHVGFLLEQRSFPDGPARADGISTFATVRRTPTVQEVRTVLGSIVAALVSFEMLVIFLKSGWQGAGVAPWGCLSEWGCVSERRWLWEHGTATLIHVRPSERSGARWTKPHHDWTAAGARRRTW